MGVFVIGIILILATALAVCAPLFQVSLSGGAEAATGEDVVARLEKQKRDAYAALKEAELDFQMGKLAQADYDAIRLAQERCAVEAMRGLEREAHGRRHMPAGGVAMCQACGQPVGEVNFCPACGAAASR